MHRTQLFLPQELHRAMTQEAQSQGITNSELVRQLLMQNLSKNSRRKTETGMQILLDMTEES